MIKYNNQDYKKIIISSREYSAKQFDKLIIYLSSGAIVFSTSFVKNIVIINKGTNTHLLIFSWILFVESLILTLISYKTSLVAMDKELDNQKNNSDKWNRITHLLNWLSLVALVTGSMLFIIFTSKNI